MAKKKPPAQDPAEEAGPKYDPADFIVAPADAKGVSYRFTFRGPPDLDTAIDQWIAANRFPFTTRGEVLRWCVREGLRRLDAMEPGVVSVTKRVDILTKLLNEETAHSEFLSVFRILEESVTRYLADQAGAQATRVVAMALHQFQAMPEGHWRDRYLLELHTRFGYLLNKPGIELGVELS